MKYVRIPPNMGRCVFSQLCQFSLMLVPCIRSKCCVVAHSAARTTGLLMSCIAFKTAGVAIPAACSAHSNEPVARKRKDPAKTFYFLT